LALVRNIEKSQGYTRLNEYMNEKYKDPSNKVKFRTYEDDGGQDLQSSSGDQKSEYLVSVLRNYWIKFITKRIID